MNKLIDEISSMKTFKGKCWDHDAFKKQLQSAQGNREKSQVDDNSNEAQKVKHRKFNPHTITRPSGNLVDLRKKLDVLLADPGGARPLQKYLRGEIIALRAKGSIGVLSETFNDFVQLSYLEKPSALVEFYKDYKDRFSKIAKTSMSTVTGNLDRVGYDVPRLKEALDQYANGRIDDEGLRSNIYASLRRPEVWKQYDSAASRLSALGTPENIQRFGENVAEEIKFLSKSESAEFSFRGAKWLAGIMSTRIRFYKYANGNAQIEFISYVKGTGGKATEWNVGGSPTLKGNLGRGASDDTSYAFAEWIASAGGEGVYNSKIIIKSKDGVPGWKRAQAFLDKLKENEGDGRFLPWKFYPALDKEFRGRSTGLTASLGGIVETKIYGSASLLELGRDKIPAQFRTIANQATRAYGEAGAGLGFSLVYNYNDPDVAVSEEHTDEDNVQTENYYGIKGVLSGAFKGVISYLDKPAVGGGNSYNYSVSFGTTDQLNMWVATTDIETRLYVPKTFFDGRINKIQAPNKGHSSQLAFEQYKEVIAKLRERSISSFYTAKEMAHKVNKNEYHDAGLTQRLGIISKHIPKEVDLGKAKARLQDLTGKKLSTEQWHRFLEKQLDGNRRNNAAFIGRANRYKMRKFRRNLSKWDQDVTKWREDNKIDALERAYQTHWPRMRDKLMAQEAAKIEKSDFAGLSEYLRSKFVLTPGTTVYTVLTGAAEKKAMGVGHSIPSKSSKDGWYRGLYKITGGMAKEQHDRLATLVVADNAKKTVANKILKSGDRHLTNAFLDIYNSQSYSSLEQNGNRTLLRPVFSGDARHIKRLLKMTGVVPRYGKSVYVVKPEDIKSGDSVSQTLSRFVKNGIRQLSDGKLSIEEMYPGEKVRAAQMERMVAKFKSINFPGASDKEIKQWLEAGVPLMLMDFSND